MTRMGSLAIVNTNRAKGGPNVMKVHPKNSINVILQVFDWEEENKIKDFRIFKSFERQKFPNIVASVKINESKFAA